MKIRIDKIIDTSFRLREKIDKEHLDVIIESLKIDGQWDPLIVRPAGDGKYELISGQYRLQAACKLGWKEIEANVKDLNDEEADFLALKTNLVRKDLEEIEEGRAIQKYVEKYGLTQTEVAKKLGKTKQWVNNRLSLVLKIVKVVQDALSKGLISPDHAVLISRISEGKYKDWEEMQRKFLNLIIEKKLSRDEARKELTRFLNDTIYTIGFSGKTINEFIQILKENEIKVLVDVRSSTVSMYKPQFSEEILSEKLKANNINYLTKPEFGMPELIRNAYLARRFTMEGTKIVGEFGYNCLKEWYKFYIKEKFLDFVKWLKDAGKPCLMCMERYPVPQGEQKLHCHRNILADLILETETEFGKFEKRVDF